MALEKSHIIRQKLSSFGYIMQRLCALEKSTKLERGKEREKWVDSIAVTVDASSPGGKVITKS